MNLINVKFQIICWGREEKIGIEQKFFSEPLIYMAYDAYKPSFLIFHFMLMLQFIIAMYDIIYIVQNYFIILTEL